MTELNLDVFNPKKAELSEIASKYRGLTINGIDDKEGYDRVHRAQMELRGIRVDIEKKGKAMREEALSFQRQVIALEKELIAEIAPVEEALKAEKEKVEAEKERIRLEAEAKERARVQGMLDKLMSVGYVADPFDIQVMDKESFEILLAAKTAEYQERKEKEEAERVRLEEERKKLEEERAKIEAERAKILEEQRKLQAEKDAQERAKAIAEAEERARKETEERMKKEAQERAEREERIKAEEASRIEAERVKQEQDAKFKAFLIDNGITKAGIDSGEWKLVHLDYEVRAYKLTATFTK